MAGQIDQNEPLSTCSRYAGLVPVEQDGRLELPPREIVTIPDELLSEYCEPYMIEQGDRIDQLAYQMLGDSRLGWLIADINATIIPDPLDLPIGTTIWVPKLETVERYR